jgi:hypothetical protein
VVLATVLALTALVLTAAPASAHDIGLAGQTSCQTDGTWTVNWSLINFGDGSHYMLVRSAGVDQGTLAGITSNPSYNGIVDAAQPDASQGGGTIVPPGSSGGVAFSSPGLPASQAAVTLTVTGFWNFDTPSGPVSDQGTEVVTVDRPPDCVVSEAGRIEIDKSTTGTSAPAGPFVFQVVQNNAVVTTVTVPANGSALSADLPPGTYSLEELSAPANAKISPNPVTVAPAATVVVTAVNTYPDVPPPVVVEAQPPVVVEAQPPVVLPPAPVVVTGPQFTG